MRLQGLVVPALLLALPAAGFVFVPTRAGVEAKWSAPLGAPASLASDSLGNVYRVGPRRVACLAERTGAVRWELPAPAGRRFTKLLDAGALVILVAPAAGDLADVQVLAVSAGQITDGAPELVWRREFGGVAQDGVYAPPVADQTEAEVVAVLAEGRLHMLATADGETRSSVALGTPIGAPTWVDGYVFVPTAVGDQAELVTVQLLDGKVDRLPARGMRQPSAAAWLGRAGVLALTGRNSLHVAKFVFVPQRTPDEGMLELPAPSGAYRLADADDGSLLLADDRSAAAYDPDHAEPRWRYQAPDGWRIADVPGSAADQVVLLEAGAEGRHRLSCLALGAAGEARLNWRRDVGTVRPNGFCVPRSPDGPLAKPVVVVLESDGLRCLDLVTGEPIAHRPLAPEELAPLWVEDSVFCVVRDGPDGKPAVLGFDFALPAELASARGGWSWTVPAGERVTALNWQAASRLLVVETDQRLYVFE